MSARQTQHSRFGFSKKVDLPYEKAVEKTRSALTDESFGVLCEIDLKSKDPLMQEIRFLDKLIDEFARGDAVFVGQVVDIKPIPKMQDNVYTYVMVTFGVFPALIDHP